jgi:hypothetical protein
LSNPPNKLDIKIVLKYDDELFKIDKNNSILSLYLYVENIDIKPHNHIEPRDFIAHNKLEDKEEKRMFIRGPGDEKNKKLYETGKSVMLKPKEICEGWIFATINPIWKLKDIEIYFEPSPEKSYVWSLK